MSIAPEPKAPTCDMCALSGRNGQIQEERGNGNTAYVCDTCGWLMEVIPDDDWGDPEPGESGASDRPEFGVWSVDMR
jgi:hypothetical protein